MLTKGVLPESFAPYRQGTTEREREEKDHILAIRMYSTFHVHYILCHNSCRLFRWGQALSPNFAVRLQNGELVA